MTASVFLKIFGDLLLCYSVISAYPTLLNPGYAYYFPALLCAVGVALAAFLDDQGRLKLRFVGIIPCIAALWLCADSMDLLLLSPALIYGTVVILRGEFAVEYYSFRDAFKKSLICWVVYILFVLFLYNFESTANPDQTGISFEAPLLYGALYAVIGIFLLRRLRMGNQSRKEAKYVDGLQLVGVLCGVAVMIALMMYAQQNAQLITKLIGDFFLMIFSVPMGLMGVLFGLFMSNRNEEVQHIIGDTQATNQYTSPEAPPMQEVVGESTQQVIQSGYPWWMVALVFAVVAGVLVAMILLLRRTSPALAVREAVTKLPKDEKKKKKEKQSNRQKVRRQYRSFLKSQKVKGVRLAANQTSAEILASIAPDTNREGAEQLRRIYLEARYNDTAHITADQVKAAKTALKKSKGE